MMYNFLDIRLSPNISTKCPVTDGYEPTNLISNPLNINNKGFLAFSAIKPPVKVDFNLICPIKLHYIIIWNTVNSQKSSGFEIHAKTGDTDYRLIGKTFPEGAGFLMCNRKIYNTSKPTVPENFSICFFKANEYKLFNSCDKIRIKIIRTISSVPCIGKIEIWGQVSYTCTEKTKETITYLMTPKKILPQPKPLDEPSTSKLKEDFEIPQEFLDDISCEMMCLPMTLPCGRTVDQSTLEKHAQEDAKWGRAPSDPYTGKAFTATHKPVLNTALKNRIDEFLLKNKDRVETKDIQRTVGRKREVPDYAITQVDKKLKVDIDNLKSTSSDDLDLAIEETLTRYNITRYSKLSEITCDKNDVKMCNVCKCDNNLYLIQSCRHYICRNCLVSISKDSVCNNCNKTFQKSNVKKYHP